MNCFLLNENVYSTIKNALEIPETKGSHSDEKFFKSIYSPATLMNDWYERRIGDQGQTASLDCPLSENMDKFRPYCKSSFPDRTSYFKQIFDSYVSTSHQKSHKWCYVYLIYTKKDQIYPITITEGLGQELLIDHLGFSYYDNYTTSYDLMFNHLKKGICGPFPRHYAKGRYLPETDLTDIYGNLTQWGLKEKVYKSQKYEDCQESSPKSETCAEFVAHDLYAVKKFNDFKNFKRAKSTF